MRCDRGTENSRPESREAEPGDPVAPRLRDEQQREAEAGDRAAELRQADQRTITAARETCPSSLTVSVYRPARCDARRRKTGEVANPFRPPSFQA